MLTYTSVQSLSNKVKKADDSKSIYSKLMKFSQIMEYNTCKVRGNFDVY